MEDNFPSLETWTFSRAFAEGCWVADAFTHETEVFTRALQVPLSTDIHYTDVLAAGVPPFLVNPEPVPPGSASESEVPPRRTRANPALSPPAGKISKGKPRASKRSTTTFITVDPADFRQMVQQVTGIQFGGTHAAAEEVLRPKPLRAGSPVAVPVEDYCPPTLDTSALWLERDRGAAGSSATQSPGSQSSFGSDLGVSGFAIDPPLPFFPTLESWGII